MEDTPAPLSSLTPLGINPEKESFFSSKTMIHLCIITGCIMVCFFICLAILVLTNKDPLALFGVLVGSLLGQAGQGTVRNLLVDGPVRKDFNGQASSSTVMSTQAQQPPNPPSTPKPTSTF